MWVVVGLLSVVSFVFGVVALGALLRFGQLRATTTTGYRLDRDLLPDYRRSRRALERELSRAKRYGRSLAAVVLNVRHETAQAHSDNGNGSDNGTDNGSMSASDSGSDQPRKQLAHVLSAGVGAHLLDALRLNDLAVWDVENNRYIVMLPETNADHALGFASRLADVLSLQTGVRLQAGIAELDDADDSLEALVSRAVVNAAKTQPKTAGDWPSAEQVDIPL